MTTIRKQTSTHLNRRALSNLVVTLIIIGVGATMAYAALGGVQDNLGSLTGSSKVVISSINAYTSGDRLVISGNIQNIGNQPLTSVVIDEITAGSLIITQSGAIADGQIAAGHGALTLEGLEHNGTTFGPITRDLDQAVAAITAGANTLGWAMVAVAGTPATDTVTEPNTIQYRLNPTAAVGGATVDMTGISIDENDLEPLAAGASKSFRIVVTGISSGINPDVLDVLRTVPASTDLFMTVTGTDGQTSTISDPRSTRVTAR